MGRKVVVDEHEMFFSPGVAAAAGPLVGLEREQSAGDAVAAIAVFLATASNTPFKSGKAVAGAMPKGVRLDAPYWERRPAACVTRV